ncbi:MAG: hypothetical protein ACI9VR_004321 [Cognaticolwellia sp.]|jgi:hypothetical protein
MMVGVMIRSSEASMDAVHLFALLEFLDTVYVKHRTIGGRMDFLSRMTKSKSIREDESASLLENDVLASDFEDGQLGFDALDASGDMASGDMASGDTASSDMASSMGAVKKSGRKAKARANDLSGTRTSEAAGAAGSAVKHGAMFGADLAFAGAGTAAGAVDGAKAVRDKSKEGRSGGKQSAKQSAAFAAGFIPLIGPFVGFAEDLYGIGKATFQPATARTKEKLANAEKLMADAREKLAELPALEERLAAYHGPDKDKFAGQLAKARGRLEDAIDSAEAWLEKKSGKGTLPLLSGGDGS